MVTAPPITAGSPSWWPSYDVERVLVGLPRSLDGSIGPAARAAQDEIEELRARLPVPVETGGRAIHHGHRVDDSCGRRVRVAGNRRP